MKELNRLDLRIVEAMRHGRNSSLTLSDNSIDGYMTAGKQFNKFLRANNLKVNEISVRRFFEANRDWAATTANFKRQALMKLIQNQAENSDSYISMAAVREMFKRNIPRTKQISQAIAEGRFLDQDQVKNVIKNASRRMGLIVEFFFVTGCRVSEMIAIKRKDVSGIGVCRVKVVGKGDKQRVVYANEALIDDINSEFKGKVFLFETLGGFQFDRNNIGKEISRVGEKVKLHLYPHIFRHSCAMHLKEMGKTPDYIKEYLGHADVSTTLRYYFHHEPDADVAGLFEMR